LRGVGIDLDPLGGPVLGQLAQAAGGRLSADEDGNAALDGKGEAGGIGGVQSGVGDRPRLSFVKHPSFVHRRRYTMQLLRHRLFRRWPAAPPGGMRKALHRLGVVGLRPSGGQRGTRTPDLYDVRVSLDLSLRVRQRPQTASLWDFRLLEVSPNVRQDASFSMP